MCCFQLLLYLHYVSSNYTCFGESEWGQSCGTSASPSGRRRAVPSPATHHLDGVGDGVDKRLNVAPARTRRTEEWRRPDPPLSYLHQVVTARGWRSGPSLSAEWSLSSLFSPRLSNLLQLRHGIYERGSGFGRRSCHGRM